MALKGLDIFKLTPKTNCKDCGNPTCMAFAMKVAQGAVALDKCPHMSDDVKAQLGDATAPPMKKIEVGSGDDKFTLGGETVLFRHDKTFVSKNLYAVAVCENGIDEKLPEILKVDYDRLGERMYVEFLYVMYRGDAAKFAETVQKAAAEGRGIILEVTDEEAAKAALAVAGDRVILSGANASNYAAFSKLATDAKAVLGVSGASLDELYDTVTALEKLGNKNLILDVAGETVKETFANAVQIRRAALKDNDRTFGYPSLVNLHKVAHGDAHLQTALAALFTLKYGSIIVMDGVSYAQALPLYGLRQNIYTDPQKPMKVEPGIYTLNGADENSVCVTTVDFALTYFVVSGELERSGVPLNLLISDAGGYSVLTAWAAGKLSANSIAKFFKEQEIESKIKSRTLVIPGKVAVLKGEIEEKLPGWTVVVAPNEAVELVKFFKEFVKA
ncbi:MAG: acetyl-CoA decarbonylase/synthase complex subunit gamma [Oscillospiraceae bacterium]|jgi:acetyl-CoA decarbonylase/synthase complex subunit gamma|nr:acetyl-CoA decarbonylase/synthase complex subunit gamma [Oscillospiraceae bacterium]